MFLKRFASPIIALLVLAACVSCADGRGLSDMREHSSESSNTDGMQESRTLEAVLDGIYAAVMPEFDVKTMKIDLNDADMLKYYTGIDDPSLVEAAIVSEAKDEGLAYSLAIIKVKDSSNAEELAKKMKASADTSRFVGKSIDTKESIAIGDMAILLLMDSADEGCPLSEDIIGAFRARAR